MGNQKPPHPPRQTKDSPRVELRDHQGRQVQLPVWGQTTLGGQAYCLVGLPMPDGTLYPQVFRWNGSTRAEWEPDQTAYEEAWKRLAPVEVG